MKLSLNFRNYIHQRLIGKFEDDPEQYYEFIHMFGTHYFEVALLGGYLHQKTIIKNNYYYRMNGQKVETFAKLTFFETLNVSGGHNSGKSSIDEEYRSNTQQTLYYYGGLTNLFDQKDGNHLIKWADSVHKDPWLFGGQLVPIENLISNVTIKKR